MELITKKKLYLVCGRHNRELSQEIADALGQRLGEPNIAEFANGEIHCKYGESIRGHDVFIINTHCGEGDLSVNDAIMEQLIMIDAARRASAKRITAVAPFYGYGRQDRKASGREPITAKLVANLFVSAGVKRLVSVDLHSGQIQGFFDTPVDHLTAMPVLIAHLRKEFGTGLVMASPDAGRVHVAEQYASELDADLAIVHKRRSYEQKNVVEARDVVGDVDGRTVVLIDDMIDTAGTMCAASEQLMEKGASEVHAVATHGLFSGPAIDRIKNSSISRVIVTNSLPLPPEKAIDKIEVLSIAPLIADAIDAVFEDTSVSEIFGGRNQS